jgi:hypothetical protein
MPKKKQSKMPKMFETVLPEEKKTWVQLKVRVPRFIKSEMKAEAARIGIPFEDYVLRIFAQRHEAVARMLYKSERNS